MELRSNSIVPSKKNPQKTKEKIDDFFPDILRGGVEPEAFRFCVCVCVCV